MVNVSAVPKLTLDDCGRITTINLKEGVKYISANMCAALTTVVMHDSIENFRIGTSDYSCPLLSKVTVKSKSKESFERVKALLNRRYGEYKLVMERI